MSWPRYRGRFAPSPTGPLHFGSLVAAVASFLEARIHGGAWLVRMEDLDRPRCRPGAAADILRTLEAFGFTWEGEVIYQSQRLPRYAEALLQLRRQGRTFPCSCSRQELADSTLAADGSRRYPGTCRAGLASGRAAKSERLRVDDEEIAFDDAVQGRIRQNLARDVGDFILLRGDGIYAYQLAVVVDDAEQGITDVVRGADLLYSTTRQILLQRLLGLPTPRYAHLPVAMDAAGAKLSKQTLAQPLSAARPREALVAALAFLGQDPPAAADFARVEDLWGWARKDWRLERVPRSRCLAAPALL